MEGLANYIGTIDLDKRTPYINPKTGEVQTEYSKSFNFGNNTEVLLPTIINGKPVSDQQAIDHFYRTGEHLGAFGTNNISMDGVNNYANKLHERQQQYYGKGDKMSIIENARQQGLAEQNRRLVEMQQFNGMQAVQDPRVVDQQIRDQVVLDQLIRDRVAADMARRGLAGSVAPKQSMYDSERNIANKVGLANYKVMSGL